MGKFKRSQENRWSLKNTKTPGIRGKAGGTFFQSEELSEVHIEEAGRTPRTKGTPGPKPELLGRFVMATEEGTGPKGKTKTIP